MPAAFSLIPGGFALNSCHPEQAVFANEGPLYCYSRYKPLTAKSAKKIRKGRKENLELLFFFAFFAVKGLSAISSTPSSPGVHYFSASSAQRA
jgi:hypothetical protein